MTRLSREFKANGIDVITLSIGEPDFDTPQHIKDAGKIAIDNNITHYPPVPGFLELREAIAQKLKRDNGLDFNASQIVVSTGAKHSLINVFMCILNQGDEVIIPAPYWVSYPEMVNLSGGTPVIIDAGIENDFKVTPEKVEAAITPKTKAFLFNSPGNPTGSVYSRSELEALADVFAKYPDILIVADEIYEYINFEGKHESLASFKKIQDRVVVVNGVSKGMAMTGWRIGYIAGPQFIATACIKLQGQYTSGTGTISQMAALEAVKTIPETSTDLKNMLSAFRERRDLLIDLVNDIPGMKTNVPVGAFYLFPDVSYYYGKSDGNTIINNSNDLSMYLLNYAHVAVVPGEAFGSPECIRISYATSKELITEAVKRIKLALEKLS
ncbi:MAG: pyridoxal phosphate-dependent aminotransferase [Bacteroidetes bacterium]|nr:pyridoxal phosphate-dependent aminotransferase [Bacteroidota bacterium]MBL6944328.1 pyridoxal phosphate-dependent aminotransferase [Bacteroidales bacterium]